MSSTDTQEDVSEPSTSTVDIKTPAKEANTAQAQDVRSVNEPVVNAEQSVVKQETPITEGTPLKVAPATSEDVSQIHNPTPSVTARNIILSESTVDLLRFVRFTDFVPCDYNKDGIVDILALNFRLSTGYGFCGIGNGLFSEGPSFDLPFRPTAAASLGNSSDMINGLFLVSSVGTVSLFYPLLDDDPMLTSKAAHFSVFRMDTANGPVFAVHGDDETFVHIYSFVNGGLQDNGEYKSVSVEQVVDWYTQITAWAPSNTQVSFPLPPTGMEKTVRVADLNSDTIPDLVYYDSGKIICSLSQRGKALVEEKTVSCSVKPTALRIADVDGNGFPDVLALIGSSGTLEVYLVSAK